MTSDLLHIKDKVAPYDYLFNGVEDLVDTPIEQELGVLPMVPKEQGHFFVVLQQPSIPTHSEKGHQKVCEPWQVNQHIHHRFCILF